jgi:hypothetical protein
MRLFSIRRVLTAFLIFASSAAWLAVVRPVAAQSVPPSVPPANIDAVHPTVSGMLVAKPTEGEGNLPSPCRDSDAASINGAVMAHRGLIVCTEEGKLVLLDLQPSTGLYYRFWGKAELRYFRDGDHVNAWGVLHDNGHLLQPTYAVQDTNVQEAFTDSQDFIMDDGDRLTLGVLWSPPKSPVQGIVYAIQGGPTHITRCNGHAGTWSDLTTGKTIDITRSLFNERLDLYIHTAYVKIVSCR